MKKFSKISALSAFTIFSFFSLVGTITAFAASPATVNLGTAGNFVILAKTGISTTGSTSIVGDMGLSPAAASYITGFALILPAASPFSTGAQITGKVYAPDYADPTPSNITTAVLDMQNAYTDAQGRAPGVTELGAGNIGGLTLAPNTYKWGTGVTIPTDVTLSGGANDIWIFQIAQNLNVSSAVKIILSGGAQAGNIFWVVAGQTTIGTGAVMNGNILDQTAIVLNTGATLNGRALAQSAVTLDANSVTIPAASSPATPATPAVPAVPTVSPATPAIPATPGTGSANSQQTNSGYVTTPSVTNSSAAASSDASLFGKQARAIAINLIKGSKNNNVVILKQFLISQNKGPSAKALAGVGMTTYFGAMTRAALAEFQANVGINPALGNFGPITRNYLNAHY